MNDEYHGVCTVKGRSTLVLVNMGPIFSSVLIKQKLNQADTGKHDRLVAYCGSSLLVQCFKLDSTAKLQICRSWLE